MANIKNIKFSAKMSTSQKDYWLLEVAFDVYFTSEELAQQHHYGEQITVREDDTFEDDGTTASTSGPSYIPTTSPVKRVVQFQATEYQLDTELGSEELYVLIQLWDVNLSKIVTQATSSILVMPF